MDTIFAVAVCTPWFAAIAILLGIVVLRTGLRGFKDRNNRIDDVIILGGGCLLTLGIFATALFIYLQYSL